MTNFANRFSKVFRFSRSFLYKMPSERASSSNSSRNSSHLVRAEDDISKIFLDLEKLDRCLFRSRHLLAGMPKRVYGGLVIGQALVAALETVPSVYHVHSLHCYFLRAGDVNMPILYQVEAVRDGRSFCTRYVKAIQDGLNIFSCQLSFQKEEASDIIHQGEMPKVKMAEDCKEAADILKEFIDQQASNEKIKKAFQGRLDSLPKTFDLRPVDEKAFLFFKPAPPRMLIWVKAKGLIGNDIRLHQCVAAYISDSAMISTALLPHVPFNFAKALIVSLDHSVWFHRPQLAIDDWMLYETESDIAAGGRAYIKGRLWSRDGTLTMSTTQEGLVRRSKI